jgi:hypothetical protein
MDAGLREFRMKLLLMFLLAFTLFGQRVVTWSPQMDHAYKNGQFWCNANSEAAAVSATVADSGQYLVVGVSIANRSNQKVDILPNGFGLSLLDPKKSPKVLDYVPPEGVIAKINRDLGWSNFGAGFAQGLATQQQTTTSNTSGTATATGPGGTANGTYNGTTTTTKKVPDQQKVQQIQQDQRRMQQKALNEIADVNRRSLRATTLEPGHEIQGDVFFKRDRSCSSRAGCSMRLVIPVTETTFEFPLVLRKP